MSLFCFKRALPALAAMLAVFVLVSPAVAIDRAVKVRLFVNAHTDSYLVSPPFVIVSPHAQAVESGRPWLLKSGQGGVSFGPGAGAGLRASQLVLKPLRGPIAVTAGGAGPVRKISGRLIARGGALGLMAEIPALDYVSQVVGSESLPDFSLEALKAQAVVVQSWLAARGPGIIGDDTNDMAFLGADYARPLCLSAARAVFDKVLVTGSGRVLKPYFHSTCAGKLSLAPEIFGSKLFYQDGKKVLANPFVCASCKGSPFYKVHVVTLKASDLSAKLKMTPLAVTLKDAAGRPLIVAVAVNGRTRDYSAYQLWLKIGQSFGWGQVPSMQYDFVRTGDKYVFTSYGAGHGIGLCQWGAQGLSQSGKDYKQILKYYFPEATVR
ncbi:MAG: SpoIID/LytB protein [Cyanobacteriota bacterium erpe_2018_sw_39hr_WHONDRS-SW48-000098_B_bin.30]|jgi:stage II sporulation protein D|nr:SpoIID/LytB protein [Cyanobacteriota bacterium erpe_2018_sw_39hr_WHONDRS-SW48-000098_B_bin.30]